MATFALIHGAGARGSDWDLVTARLQAAGHDVTAPDLPCEDEGAGLAEYCDTVVGALGECRDEIVVVAHSLGGLTAPVVADAVGAAGIVLLTAMVPRPGEPGGEWWATTGHHDAFRAQDLPDDSDETLYFHDVPPDVLATTLPSRGQTGRLLEEPCPLAAWPAIATRFLLCTDDRFFPPEWMRGVVRERLGIEPEEVPGGHCAYLSRPAEIAAAILDGLPARAHTAADAADDGGR